ncbi:MAG: hypothetical protein SVT52_01120 [Planctomycetota bacterium]|nr:hypothetical protein [Planctomycetota bacterium]
MTFRRYGRSVHLVIRTAEDLRLAAALDEAHWVAVSAPVETIRCDETFLRLVDRDGDGRILACDVKAAIRWACDVLRDRVGLAEQSATLSLGALNDESGDGRKVRASAEKVLEKLNRPGAAEITLDDVRRLKVQVRARPVSEAGVVLPAAGGPAEAMNEIRLVEKLLLYQVHLMDLANNFVSFPHLYNPARQAMFEMGRLVMDGRRFNFAMKVNNREQHAAVAAGSNMFVLYVAVTPGAGQAYEVAVPVTSGSRGNLCVHKRGIFQDVAGRQCPAQVVHIIENPVSITEAMVSPFKRMGRLLTGKIESIAATAEEKVTGQASTTAQATDAPASKPPTGLHVGGLLVGGGVAVAALGSAAAYITKTLGGLEWWKILIGLAAAVLAVMLPTSIVAFLKLRRRDLSAILEGSGWAVNAQMCLTGRQSRYFTQRPDYPQGARGTNSRLWAFVVVIVVLAAVVAAVAYLLL